MIKVINRRVLIMIALLSLACGGGGYSLYTYITPMRLQDESEVRKIQQEIEAKRQEVAKLKEEFVLLQIQLRKYKELESNGFFNNQNRVKAKESFDLLLKLSGILKARFTINNGEQVVIKQASDANHVVLRTPVSVELDSLDDVDVFTFIKGLQEKFPGSVDMTKVQLTRIEHLNPDLVRKIGAGEPLKLISSRIDFDWRTMANYARLNESDTSSFTSTAGTETVSASSTPAVSEAGGTGVQADVSETANAPAVAQDPPASTQPVTPTQPSPVRP